MAKLPSGLIYRFKNKDGVTVVIAERACFMSGLQIPRGRRARHGLLFRNRRWMGEQRLLLCSWRAKGDQGMKKSAGRKALRMRMRQNRRAEGRKRAKENELRQRHPKSTKREIQIDGNNTDKS